MQEHVKLDKDGMKSEGVAVAETQERVPPYRVDTLDKAMAAIDKLNAMCWMLIDAFDNGTPCDSVTSGIHAILTESTDALETFVNEVRKNTRR